MSTSSKATAPTAREVAASIKALGGRLTALVDKLVAAGDAPVPAAGFDTKKNGTGPNMSRM